jgi:glycine betaine/proline transport system substrate-binding protein
MPFKRLLSFLFVLTALPVLAAACGGGKAEPIIFSDLNWNSAQVQNRIVMFIVENGYGYPVSTVAGDAVSLQAGLQNGDTHVTMEVWLPNQQAWWDEAIPNKQVVLAGKSLDDTWRSMFVVPTYVIEQNPGLRSVDDLAGYMGVFETPDSNGRARLITCLVEWQCQTVNAEKVAAYGLEDVVALTDLGSRAAYFTDLEDTYRKGEPWLGYLWGPFSPVAGLDMTVLEEPAYSSECWEMSKRCAYPTSETFIAVHPSLVERAPAVVEFLGNYQYMASVQLAVEQWVTDNDATVDEAAIWYLESRDEWKRFVPREIAEKVEAALAAL